MEKEENRMRIIDAHAHIFPPKIAEKASRAIGKFYDAPIMYDGSIEKLLTSGNRISVEYYVVHSTATTVDQVGSINNFIMDACQKESRFIGFGTMHPEFSDIHEEFDRIQRGGLRGLKLHPDFQNIAADDPSLDPVYEELSARALPVLIHAGDIRYDLSGPRRLSHVLDKHPRLKMIAAHFGGYTQWKESFEVLAGRECWFDTSSSLWKLSPEEALAILNKHGLERFLFGSDFPMWDHSEELKRLDQLNLEASQLKSLLWDNAASLLSID